MIEINAISSVATTRPSLNSLSARSTERIIDTVGAPQAMEMEWRPMMKTPGIPTAPQIIGRVDQVDAMLRNRTEQLIRSIDVSGVTTATLARLKLASVHREVWYQMVSNVTSKVDAGLRTLLNAS